MAKLIYTNGDSWTAGDIVDPELFGTDNAHVNHPKNKQYRLPRVWPGKLGKLLKTEVINNSVAGASNDRIVRGTINDILELKQKYNTEDIFVIIGWSSPERKDFFYKWDEKDTGEWECLYPAELDHWESKSDSLNAFYKLYTLNHWHEEEFITRHCLNNITLHNFLKALNIRHLFFNAFYESKEELFNPDKHQLFDAREIESYISNYQKSSEANTLKRLDINNIIDEYKRIHKEVFTKKSFIQFLLNLSEYNQDDLIDYHPTELGHELWAKELSTVLKNEI